MPNSLRIEHLSDIIPKTQIWLVVNLPVSMFAYIHFNVPPTGVTDLVRNVSDEKIYTILQNKRMRRCGVPPPSPPIIFERLKLPQQIIYHRKGNLSESPNHLKYRENILISRFYEQFSRSSRNLGHFWKFKKISNS